MFKAFANDDPLRPFVESGPALTRASGHAWLALACFAFSGCVYTTRYSFTALEAIPRDVKNFSTKSNIAWAKLDGLRLRVFTWDAVPPGETAPSLALLIELDADGPGFSFDPMRVSIDVPGEGVPVRPRSYEGPGTHAYHGFGVDACSGGSLTGGASGQFPLTAKQTCFVLAFDVVVSEPLELRLDGITRDGLPVDVPRLRLLRREGKVLSVPDQRPNT
jgi:hypothetical protein